MSQPKIALVYDRVNKIGGAERVLTALHQLYPDAPLYTSVYSPDEAKWAEDFQVIPSFLQKVPFARRRHELFAWMMPSVFESFNFDKYDIVISITSAEAKGILTKPQTLHISYTLTPTRYLWSHTHLYRQYAFGRWAKLMKPVTTHTMTQMRQWDYLAASRVDRFVAISNTVAKRISKYYRRPVDQVIYPPTPELESSQTLIDHDPGYYLLVSRLVPYKRVDLAIEAFNRLPDKRLVVIGQGSQFNRLRSLANENVTLMGKVSAPRLSAYYQHSQALVFPTFEDFGLVCVEAQQFGKPVIALNRGGAREIIKEPDTGVLFNNQDTGDLIEAIERFERLTFNPNMCKRNASRFDLNTFKGKFTDYMEEVWQQHQASQK